MLKRPLIALSATLAGLGFFAAPASAQGTPPVVISSCTVLRAAPLRPAYPNYWYPYYGARFPQQSVPITDGLAITYQNVGTTVADRVAFEVNYRGQRDKVVDVGKFSPGVSIAHTFGNYEGLAYLGQTPDYCRVAAVRFVDGHVWRSKHAHMQAR